jgi:hypothetical protein
MNKNPLEAKQKLFKAYDPALCALTGQPQMVYESGRVRIKAPIAAATKAGPYDIRVQAITPNHLSGSLKPQPISGFIMVKGIRYKFNADLEFKADVIFHPSPKGVKESPVRATQPVKEVIPVENPNNSTDWSKVGKYADEIFTVVGITILTFLTPSIRMSMATSSATTSYLPFHHSIDPRRHGYPGDA